MNKIFKQITVDDCCHCDDPECQASHKPSIDYRPSRLTSKDKLSFIIPANLFFNCKHCYLLSKFKIIDKGIEIYCPCGDTCHRNMQLNAIGEN